jgi:bifunctional N-acetylglucosamine-1-phosphate-uridyltransferase/glucosamine-1-phosphate-acetyltransferase GlmU-like protein
MMAQMRELTISSGTVIKPSVPLDSSISDGADDEPYAQFRFGSSFKESSGSSASSNKHILPYKDQQLERS